MTLVLMAHGSVRQDDLLPCCGLDDRAMAFLDALRARAMACRPRPHVGLFHACALLHVDKSASQTAHADALVRCLNEALGKPARLHAPKTKELTFDERWLAQLATACVENDKSSQRFLIDSRVVGENRRLVSFLIHSIAGFFW